jgi:hypothetical protein
MADPNSKFISGEVNGDDSVYYPGPALECRHCSGEGRKHYRFCVYMLRLIYNGLRSTVPDDYYESFPQKGGK